MEKMKQNEVLQRISAEIRGAMLPLTRMKMELEKNKEYKAAGYVQKILKQLSLWQTNIFVQIENNCHSPLDTNKQLVYSESVGEGGHQDGEQEEDPMDRREGKALRLAFQTEENVGSNC